MLAIVSRSGAVAIGLRQDTSDDVANSEPTSAASANRDTLTLVLVLLFLHVIGCGNQIHPAFRALAGA